jgi:DNA-binding LytR/AlgR family response regulator
MSEGAQNIATKQRLVHNKHTTMEPIRCIVVDDEFPARALLQDFISKVPGLELCGSFKSPIEAMPLVQQNGVDLMFLDIQMPDLNGVDFVKILSHKPLVVFTTAYSEYAVESFQLDVVDYLLKPFSFDRFLMSVNRAVERFQKSVQGNVVIHKTELSHETKEVEKGYIAIKADHKIHRVKHENILYIEGLREYVTFFCRQEKIITLESLRNLENSLPPNQFMRVHKSYIINKNCVKSLYGNQLIMEGTNQIIPIGKSYRDEVQAKLFEANQ